MDGVQTVQTEHIPIIVRIEVYCTMYFFNHKHAKKMYKLDSGYPPVFEASKASLLLLLSLPRLAPSGHHFQLS